MRYLHADETPLVRYVLCKAGLRTELSQLDSLLVEIMDDGGMGSLRFCTETKNPKLGSVAAECVFQDFDSIDVLVTLNLDQYGKLFELDMWKINYSALRRWPQAHDIRDL